MITTDGNTIHLIAEKNHLTCVVKADPNHNNKIQNSHYKDKFVYKHHLTAFKKLKKHNLKIAKIKVKVFFYLKKKITN